MAWYRSGGLEAVRSHRGGGHGQVPRLTLEEQEHLAQEVATGRFRNAAAIGAWITATYGVTYREGGCTVCWSGCAVRPKSRDRSTRGPTLTSRRRGTRGAWCRADGDGHHR